jgi:hypothetical protein
VRDSLAADVASGTDIETDFLMELGAKARIALGLDFPSTVYGAPFYRRVLRSRGLFVCSTPNREVPRWYTSNPFHIHEFLPREFMTLLEQCFSECRMYGQSEVFLPLRIPRVLVARFLQRINVKERLKRFLRRPTVIAQKPNSARYQGTTNTRSDAAVPGSF